ncbi:hypothetical protein BDN72DRAFT_846714 [Pluteus cervinus]|uniref:Uncharacterized protein n=1 Tax=Pluteus cervinus TaxID=181527 RepID=A0ACD3AF64_9AGAR|nr:hypothetical protein BDN72DRAFT_846714 [Pluteus cervinus]
MEEEHRRETGKGWVCAWSISHISPWWCIGVHSYGVGREAAMRKQLFCVAITRVRFSRQAPLNSSLKDDAPRRVFLYLALEHRMNNICHLCVYHTCVKWKSIYIETSASTQQDAGC